MSSKKVTHFIHRRPLINLTVQKTLFYLGNIWYTELELRQEL